jgi:FMN-dependent NADH-azoreductase
MTPIKLLHIDSSISGERSASRRRSAVVVAALTQALPDLDVVRRDLDADPIAHLDSRRLPTVWPANAPSAKRRSGRLGRRALCRDPARDTSGCVTGDRP